jgi:hypothetical protein
MNQKMPKSLGCDTICPIWFLNNSFVITVFHSQSMINCSQSYIHCMPSNSHKKWSQIGYSLGHPDVTRSLRYIALPKQYFHPHDS